MKQKRLEAICSFLTKEDRIIDIGCDHAYVSIEMAQRNTKKILATDIHPKALEMAKKNIASLNLEHQIECQQSDGLENIDPSSYDTLVIAGMGTSTIIHILSNQEKLKSIQKMVIQTNNELDRLRAFINSNGYELKKERVVFEKKHYYVVMLWKKGTKKLTKEEINFGLYSKENQGYYQYLKAKNELIYKEIPWSKFLRKWGLKKQIKTWNKYIQKSI